MTIRNYASEYVRMSAVHGHRQMKLYHEMKAHNDWPLNDCQLFMNLGAALEMLADDWAIVNSNMAQIAINQKAIELMNEMCDLYNCVAIQKYIEQMKVA